MKKGTAIILLLTVISCFLCGCSIEKVRAMDGVKPEYTVMKEEDYPEKVKELIGENKAKEFQMTYQDADMENRKQEGTAYKLKIYPCGIMQFIYRRRCLVRRMAKN